MVDLRNTLVLRDDNSVLELTGMPDGTVEFHSFVLRDNRPPDSDEEQFWIWVSRDDLENLVTQWRALGWIGSQATPSIE